MSDVITFAGEYIISTTDLATFTEPKVGVKSRVYKIERLARSTREIVKDLGVQGADISFTVHYFVTRDGLDDLHERIEALATTSAMGTLSIPDHRPYTNCVMLPPQIEQVTVCELEPQAGSATGASEGYHVTVAYSFRRT